MCGQRDPGASVAVVIGSVRRLGPRLPDGMADAAWLWLALRLGLGLVALLVVVKGAAPQPCNSDDVINGWRTLPPLSNQGIWFPLVGVWQHWDACWYSKIAAYGYEPGVPSTNFFPLLPFFMGAGAVLTGGNAALAGLIVNAFAFVAALTGLYQLVRDDFDSQVARRSVLLLAVFPASFFFLAPFTESLFLAGAVWSIAGARRGRWDITFVASLAAGLARPQGLVLVLPLAWEALRTLRARIAEGHGWRHLRPADGKPLLTALTPAAAYIGFLAYTMVVVRVPYFGAHGAWASTALAAPWDPILAAFGYAVSHHDPAVLMGGTLFVFFALLTIGGIRRLPASYTLYSVPQMILMTTQQTAWPMMSTIRYLAVLFPCFVVLAVIGRRDRFNTGWIVVSTMLLGYFAAQFVAGAMVG